MHINNHLINTLNSIMSLPKNLYDNYHLILKCNLITSRTATDENITVFQQLLNDAQPTNEDEVAQRTIIWGMYQANPIAFTNYIKNKNNRVQALILWTESKRIAQVFKLRGLVHVGWSQDDGYTVCKYITPTQQDIKSMQQIKSSAMRGRGRGRGRDIRNSIRTPADAIRASSPKFQLHLAQHIPDAETAPVETSVDAPVETSSSQPQPNAIPVNWADIE